MGLLQEMDVIDSGDLVSFNTGTMFDLGTGKYSLGVDGEWYLNGGLLPHINSFVALPGNYKSTLANSMVRRSHGIYKDSELIINDTEDSLDKDKDRANRMAEELSRSEDILWLKGIDYDLDTFDAFLKDYCAKKEAASKSLMRQTPFIDERTGEQISVMAPTYVFIDSLTEMVCAGEEDLLEGEKSKGIGDSRANTVYMLDGNKKTIFLRTMRRRCQKYNIVFVMTGHYDKVIQMDVYNPNPKETLFSKQDYKVKGCGSKLKFLTSIYARCAASVLIDSNKEALYADGNTPDKDLHEVDVVLERCKTANAGEMIPYVCSQSNGLLNAVTNYHYLRLHDYYGLLGNKMKQQTVFLPDVTVSRNTVREIANSNYEFRRALELTAQYCFIKNNWNHAAFAFDFKKDPKEIMDALMSDKNRDVKSEILNSRGYWTFMDQKDDRNYMSLFMVLKLAGCEKK